MTKSGHQGSHTAAIHAGLDPAEHRGAVSVPIYQTSTFAFPTAEEGAAQFVGLGRSVDEVRCNNGKVIAKPQLTHRIDGEGPPLILLNGGLMSIAAWDPFVAALATRWRIVRCDFRGQLRTGGPFPRSLDEHAQDVVDLLDSLGIESAHWAGVSFGAEVAMVAAARHGHRVARLTVITATERTDERMRRDAAEGRAFAESAAAGGEGAAELIRQIFTQTWSDQWLARQQAGFLEARVQQLRALPREFFAGAAAILGLLDDLDLTPFLGDITAPALVIGGANDRVFPPEHSRAIADAIPGARLEIIEGTGHGLLFECAGRVIELLS